MEAQGRRSTSSTSAAGRRHGRAAATTREFAERIFKQIQGFGEYGFPESHAASFALLVYVSSWLKCHHPAAFLAALLNSQPMGFYAPAQLVQDAQRHGVEVRPVDVDGERLGLHARRATFGCRRRNPPCASACAWSARFARSRAERIVAARAAAAVRRVPKTWRAAPQLDARDLHALARADALPRWPAIAAGSCGAAGHGTTGRRRCWPTRRCVESRARTSPQLVAGARGRRDRVDYARSASRCAAIRWRCCASASQRRGWQSAQQLAQLHDGARAWACGIVTVRQRPQTAKGTIFVTLEDETGSVNVIVWSHVREAQRQRCCARACSRWRAVAGAEGVSHLVARRLIDMTPWLGGLATGSRDFH